MHTYNPPSRPPRLEWNRAQSDKSNESEEQPPILASAGLTIYHLCGFLLLAFYFWIPCSVYTWLFTRIPCCVESWLDCKLLPDKLAASQPRINVCKINLRLPLCAASQVVQRSRDSQVAPAKANIKPVKLGGESTSRSGAYDQTEWKKIKTRVKQASCWELVEPTGRGQSREAGTGLGYSREAGRALSGNSRSFESVKDSTAASTDSDAEKLKWSIIWLSKFYYFYSLFWLSRVPGGRRR